MHADHRDAAPRCHAEKPAAKPRERNFRANQRTVFLLISSLFVVPLTQRPRDCWASSRTTPSAIPQSDNTVTALTPMAGGGVEVGGTVLLNRGDGRSR